jgi:hypothetical protein
MITVSTVPQLEAELLRLDARVAGIHHYSVDSAGVWTVAITACGADMLAVADTLDGAVSTALTLVHARVAGVRLGRSRTSGQFAALVEPAVEPLRLADLAVELRTANLEIAGLTYVDLWHVKLRHCGGLSHWAGPDLQSALTSALAALNWKCRRVAGATA